MLRSLFVLVVLSILLWPAAAGAQDDILPFTATETTLQNGLKVIVVPTAFPNLISLQIPIQTGSRNEVEPGKSGFAHFFEHMMFRGTEKHPPEVYQNILTRAGASNNAYTTDDYTNYHITFAKEDLEKMLEIEADRFMSLKYPLADFQTEALAVLGEYNKNFTNPIRKLFEVQRDAAYQVHTYKHTTMGFLADIKDMPNQYEYSRTFFDRWYRPEYATVMVVGDVTPEEVLPLVEKHFGGWQRGSYTVEIPAEPEPAGPVYVHHEWPTPTAPLLTVAFHGPAFSEEESDSAALEMLLGLEFGETSDLYRRLVQEEQKVDFLAAMNAADQDPSLFTVLTRVKDPADVVEVRDAILRTFAAARAEPVKEDRLREAISHQRYAFAANLDRTEAVAGVLARYVRFRRSYDTVNNLYRLYDALTPEQLLGAAQKYFTDNRLVVATVSHELLAEAVRTSPSLDSLCAPAAEDEAAAGRLVIQKTASPQIVMKLLFLAGSADDPPGKEGLADLAARMIADAGSDVLTLAEIQKLMYPMAGRFSAQVDREMTVFTGSIHRDNLEQFSSIVLDMLINPGLRPEDFKRNREAQQNALKLDLCSNNDEELGKERLQANIFAGTSYGHPTVGTAAGIEVITSEDVARFIASHYTWGNLVLGLSGDVPDDLVERLRNELSSNLPAGKCGKEDAGAPAGKRSNGISVEIVQKETRATAISLGHPLQVTRKHPDFVPLYLARTWLGEHRSSMSRLYQRIREERGMNYGDYAYIEAFPRGMFQFYPDPNRARLAQIFEIWIRPVPPEQAQMALRIALHELEQMIVGGLTEEQFEATRQYLLKNVFVMTDGQDTNLGYSLDSWYYGLPEYTEYLRDRLRTLTCSEVNRAIAKHLSHESLHVVMITRDAEGLRDQLLADAFSPMVYNSEKPAELLEEDRIIGARRLNLDPEDVRITPLAEVFAR